MLMQKVSKRKNIVQNLVLMVLSSLLLLSAFAPTQLVRADHSLEFTYLVETYDEVIEDFGVPINGNGQDWQFCGINPSDQPWFRTPGNCTAGITNSLILLTETSAIMVVTDGFGVIDENVGSEDVHNVTLPELTGEGETDPPDPPDDPNPAVDGEFYFYSDPTQMDTLDQVVVGPDGTTYSFCSGNNPAITGDCGLIDINDAPTIEIPNFPPDDEVDSMSATWVGIGNSEFVSITILNDSDRYEFVPPDDLENDGGASQDECSAYSVLGWLLCSITTGFLSFIQNIFNGIILNQLVVSPLDDSPTADPANQAIFDIWNSFRIIANILFVVVFLVSIFGQGLAGFQVFSAYDFRKILPRLFLGVIGIQLS